MLIFYWAISISGCFLLLQLYTRIFCIFFALVWFFVQNPALSSSLALAGWRFSPTRPHSGGWEKDVLTTWTGFVVLSSCYKDFCCLLFLPALVSLQLALRKHEVTLIINMKFSCSTQ
jgi:hypothetical protein